MVQWINISLAVGQHRRVNVSSVSSLMSSSISADVVHSIVEKLKWEQHRSSTQKAYYSAWKSFNKFYVRLDTRPKNWEDHLTLFVAYMINDRKKSTTIKSYISAIKAVLFELDEPMNENTALLRALTKACRLQNDQVKARLPIRKLLLTSILRNLPDSFQSPQEYLTILYRAHSQLHTLVFSELVN